MSRDTIVKILKGQARPLTFRQHRYAWRRFKKFCKERKVESLPADPNTVSSYLAWLWEVTGATNMSAVPSAAKAINFVHCKLNRLPSPCEGFLTSLIMKGVAEERDRPAVSKEFIPLDSAKKAYRAWWATGDVVKRFLASLFILGIIYLCRFSDLQRCKFELCILASDRLRLGFLRRKNVKLPSYIELGFTRGYWCPRNIWLRLLSVLPANLTGTITCKIAGGQLVPHNSMTYSFFVKHLRAFLVDGGVPRPIIKRYASQSMRSGGASTLHEAGASEGTIDKQGAWRDPASKVRYCRTTTVVAQRTSHLMGL